MNHESVGISLHEVGGCLVGAGHLEEARTCYERAVAEKKAGDIFGNVDTNSVVLSLRAGAECLRLLGASDEAVAWELEATALTP